MYYLRFILIFILLIECLGTEGNAQCLTGHEQDQWYIQGQGILDFNESPPKTITQTQFWSYELSSGWCNADGDLLLYTNGAHIYNRNHTILPKGKIFIANASSTTHGLILPRPGSDSLFDVFIPESTDSHDSLKTLWHIVVDLSLDGGLGEVISTQPLYKGTSERVAAIRQCNGQDWWLVCRAADGNRFITWPITQSGLGTNIISDMGYTVVDDPSAPCSASAGQMKFSPDGHKLAINYASSFCKNSGSIVVEILAFNSETGKVGNSEFLFFNIGHGYGVEFSPDISKLYFSRAISPQWANPIIYQQDLFDYDTPPVLVHQYPTGEYINIGGGLATGPDGRIYVSDYPNTWLHVIDAPNEAGPACNFLWKGLDISPGESGLGMPTMPAGYWRPHAPWLSGQSQPRSCEQWTYTVSHTCAPGTWTEWTYHGANTIAFSDQDSLVLNFHTPGLDTLIATRYSPCDTVSDTLVIIVKNPFVASWSLSDSQVCAGEAVSLYIHSPLATREIIQSDGSILPFATDTFQLGPFIADSCFSLRLSDGVCDTLFPICITALIGPTTTDTFLLCAGENALVHGQLVSQSGDYPLTLSAVSGCDSLSTVTVLVSSTPTVSTIIEPPSCPGETDGLISIAPSTGMTFTWSDGMSTPIRDDLMEGLYAVSVSTATGCDTVLSLEVSPPASISVTLPPDITIEAGGAVTLQPVTSGVGGLTFVWSPAIGLSCVDCDVPIAAPTSTTTYTVVINDSRGCIAQASVQIRVSVPSIGAFFPTAFSPNGDGISDAWQVLAGEEVVSISRLDIYDRWGGLLHHCADFPLLHPACAWDGKSNGQHVDPGMYLWQARILLTDGTVVQRQGEVEVVR